MAHVAFNAGQGQSVVERHLVELIQGQSVSGDPCKQSDLKGQAVAVPRSVELRQVPEPALAGLVNRAAGKDGNQRAEHAEHDPDVEEHKGEGLAVFVQRRRGLAFEGVFLRHEAAVTGRRGGDHAEQQTHAGEREDGRPFWALTAHQHVGADEVDRKQQANEGTAANGWNGEEAEGRACEDRPGERVDVDAGRTSRSARRLGTRPSIAPAATMSSGYRSFSNPRPKPPIWSVSIAKRTAIGARSRPSDVFDDAVVSFVVVMGYPSLRATAWLEQLRDLWCRYNRFGPIRGRSHPSECSIQLRMLNTRTRADVTAVMGALQREV